MKSLTLRITLISILVLVFSTGIVGIFSINSSRKSLQSQLEKSLEESVHATAESIKASNEKEFKMLETLAALPEIRSPELSLLEKAHIIYGTTSLDEDYIDVAILDKEGNSWINNGARLISFAERDYYKEPLATGCRYTTDPFINKVTDAMAVFYSVPVFDSEGTVINVIFCVIDGFRPSDLASGHIAGNGRPAFMVSLNTGLTIASENHELVAAQNLFDEAASLASESYTSTMNAIKSGKTGISRYTLNGETYICAYEKVPDINWMVVNTVPFSDFESDLNKTTFIIIMFCVGFTLFAAIIVFLAITHSLKPLLVVRQAITEISTGNADLTKRLPNTSNDEVGAVVTGFNQFEEKLQDIVAGIKQSKETLAFVGSRMSTNAEKTADNINTVYNSIEEMQNIILNQTDSVEHTADAVRQISQDIQQLEEKQELVNQQINEMKKQSKTMQTANRVIASIASKTNLLAMNAAIEAAHAGEAGRGFSVVAEEIKRLAENSAKESSKITDEIAQIMASMDGVVASSTETIEAFKNVSSMLVSNGRLESSESVSILDEVNRLQSSTFSMRTVMEQISGGADLINRSGSELSEIAPQMQSTIDDISAQIDQFRI